jgi:hypothetical protein
VTAGNRLVATACGVVAIVDTGLHGASLDCRNLNTAAGAGEIRVEGGSREEVVTGFQRVERAVRAAGIPDYHAFIVGPAETGRTTVYATAPVWLPPLAVGLVTLVPWRRRPATPPVAAPRPAASAPPARRPDPLRPAVPAAPGR